MIEIKHWDRTSDWNRKLLCVAHADRPTEPERCALNFLEQRYAQPNRLPAQVPFESLTPISQHQPYGGSVTIWGFDNQDFSKPKMVAFLRPDYKPQHAVWHQQKLWILAIDHLEVYAVGANGLHQLAEINDPWMSGTHTIFPDGQGRMLVSCSASDSVLIVDAETYKVVAAWRLPEEIYGRNFELARTDSTVDHYIHNDLQLTHINCATPWRGGVVISTLAQGALGWFDPSGKYTELLRGFVGCHGVRADARTNRLYFSDSCMGVLTCLNERLGIERRIATNSIWLHDAEQLDNDWFAVSVTDRNQIEILDTQCRQVVAHINCAEFGLGPQLISYSR